MLVALTGFGIYFLGKTLPSELAPLEDRNRISVQATGPEGSSYEFMDNYMRQAGELVRDSVGDDLDNLLSVTAPGFSGNGSNTGIMRVLLKPADERTRSQQQLADVLTGTVKKLSAARASVSQDQSIGSGGGGLPVQFVLQTQDFEKLRTAVPKFLEAAKADPTFTFVDVNLKFNKPELRVNIDRAKAQSLGLSVQDISQTLQAGLSGSRYGYFLRNGKQYQIIGQVAREDRSQPLDVRSLTVKSRTTGRSIQLDNVIRLEEKSTPPQLYRFNRYNAATFSASLAPGKTLGDGIAAMQAISKKTLDDSFSTALAGASRDFAESSSSLIFAFGLALVLIYLILAAQFESFRDPAVIMFTVPLALAGALLSLWYFNQTLNLFSQIGIIMLVGLVTKNGILIVEFANQRVENEGVDYMTGLIEGATARFRPILMTSLCAILGILPIAVATGAGALSRRAMGIGVVGGLLFATGLTLYVVPVMYSYFASAKKHKPKAAEAVVA